MNKTLIGLFLFLFSLNCYSSVNEQRISNIESILSKSLDAKLFNVIPDQSKPNLLRIELNNSLDDNYKNKLHLWLIDSAKTNPQLKNIFLTRETKKSYITASNILNASLTLASLLTFLFLMLTLLSKKKAPEIEEDDYTDVLTRKIEAKVEKIMLEPTHKNSEATQRNIDYL